MRCNGVVHAIDKAVLQLTQPSLPLVADTANSRRLSVRRRPHMPIEPVFGTL